MNPTTAVAKHTITVAVLAARLAIQSPGATADVLVPAVNTSVSGANTEVAGHESAARKIWRDTIANSDAPGDGCFHASYPSYVWEKVECKAAPKRNHALYQVGNTHDYDEISSGLIGAAKGSFKVYDVKSVQTEGASCSYFGFVCDGVNGRGQYSLQLNTNDDQSTSVCAGGNSGCRVWQQFIYSTQTHNDPILNPIGLDNSPHLFIQFWLVDYGPHCPKNWDSVSWAGLANCVLNSPHASPPYVPVSDLGDVQMIAGASPGGYDVLEFFYNGEVWTVADKDNTLKIGTVWRNVEFNVFGNGGGSQANFNNGAAIDVTVQIQDGTTTAPLCGNQGGTTGETNNLFLRSCSAWVVDTHPTIEFTEASLVAIVTQPPGGPVGPPHGGHVGEDASSTN